MIDWDLRKFRILRELHRQGTVTAAAQALSLTPSAVSQSLAALARQIGSPVVEPQGRRVRLTEAAHLLLRHGDEIFAELERAEAELAAYTAGDTGLIRVGSFATGVPALVTPAVVRLRAEHPGLRVQVREAEAAEVYDLLDRGEIDLGLSLAPAGAPTGPTARRRFTRSTLLADPLDLALPAGHPLAAAGGDAGPPLRLAQLADEPWIFGAAGPWREITLTACATAGFSPEPAHTASDWTAILALVAAGLGVALVPRLVDTAPHRPAVAVRPLPADRPTRQVVAAVRRGSHTAPRLRLLLDALNEAAGQGD
ncbi:LysR family transcriptional regulator [Phaeacidiphilus oryzae]|jgi:DNA-binding transcriptional LysR family regulator|uniref:LysR family transcriptional regulator n=1 Tax=Phaeacidiphilus oryzae TaxID=348818 RepID=UPI000560667F|nr:LysR substrate-binding domain-containing protein [Phaeacidiphilus oryzae]